MITTKKLKCNITREQIEDLKHHHGIDAEAELSRLLGEEINRNIVKNLKNYIKNNKTKEIKRIYSDLDPYGEEDWED